MSWHRPRPFGTPGLDSESLEPFKSEQAEGKNVCKELESVSVPRTHGVGGGRLCHLAAFRAQSQPFQSLRESIPPDHTPDLSVFLP